MKFGVSEGMVLAASHADEKAHPGCTCSSRGRVPCPACAYVEAATDRDRPAPMLLERREALDQLSQLLTQAAGSRGRVALIGGEAGIGKTALLREFADHASAAAAPLWGGCDPMFTPRPLGPLHDMATALGDGVLAALGRDHGRLEVFTAVLDALGRDAHCLVFEDLHWADEATLDLLAYLGRRIEHTRTLLLCTYRDDEIGRTHPLRRLLGSLQDATRITLAPLSADAVRRLAGQRRVDAVALHAVSGGNPFFVTELLALDGAATAVPPTVRDAVLARVAPLSPRRCGRCSSPRPCSGRGSNAAAARARRRHRRRHARRVPGRRRAARGRRHARVPPRAGAAGDARVPSRRRSDRPCTDACCRSCVDERHDVDSARLAHHAEAARDRDAVLEYAPLAARQAVAVGARRQAHAQYARALRFADALPPAALAAPARGLRARVPRDRRRQAGIDARQQAITLRRQLGDPARQAENLCRLSNLFVACARSARRKTPYARPSSCWRRCRPAANWATPGAPRPT